ncbi:MAG: hypothetical protein R8K20_11685 [Gallionellaceae bacterium]
MHNEFTAMQLFDIKDAVRRHKFLLKGELETAESVENALNESVKLALNSAIYDHDNILAKIERMLKATL